MIPDLLSDSIVHTNNSAVKKDDSIFVEINNQLVPFFIKSVSKNANRLVLKLDEVNTIEQAELLKHTSVYLPLKSSRKDTPKTIPNNLNSIQFSNLIGYSVIDQVHGPIGTIEAILEFPSHNILQIRNSDKTEILIPAIEAFVLKMDHEKKSLEMNTPEGLISVYLK